jgi:hypothetical protein
MKKGTLKLIARFLLLGSVSATFTACAATSSVLNPFYEAPTATALLGQPNDHALRGDKDKEDSARQALEAMASYQRAHAPQPANPVVQPAVVRMMWIPDHLNKNGDLIPAHYYYLRVLKDRWAVSDAFELESQLQGPAGSSNIPYILESDARNISGR